MTQTNSLFDAEALAKRLLQNDIIKNATQDEMLAALTHLVQNHQDISPQSNDLKRAFVGFINLAGRTNIQSQAGRETAFLCAYLNRLAEGHGHFIVKPFADIATYAPMFQLELCDDPGQNVLTFKASKMIAQIGFKTDLKDDDFEKSFIDFIGKTRVLQPTIATLNNITQHFADYAPLPDSIEDLQATFLPPRSAAGTEVSQIFDQWTPRIVSFKNMQPHPAKLIEAKTLASVPVKLGGVIPRLPQRAIETGALSDAQLEAITIAANAFERFITITSDEQTFTVRSGFLLADGAGVGKTNEAAGIMHSVDAKGCRRHIIVVEKEGHIKIFQKALRMIGSSIKLHRIHDVLVGDRLIASDGAIILTYAMLRQRNKENELRIAPLLVGWMNDIASNQQGCIIFDEAQNLRHAPDGSATDTNWWGGAVVSDQAYAACFLQDKLPNAHVLYASATSATELTGTAYMSRLGMWGPDTPYKDFGDFEKRITRDTVSLEAIPLHLKSTGLMVCRTLSLEGVKYGTIHHHLDDHQTNYYQDVTDLMAKTFAFTKEFGERFKSKGMPTLANLGILEHDTWNASLGLRQVQTMIANQMIDSIDIALKMPTILEATDRALDNDHAIVFQLSHTMGAETLRSQNAGMAQNSITAPMVHLFDTVILPALKHLPLAMMPSYTEQAEKLRNEWMSVPTIRGALDQIMAHYGQDRLAELTGRHVRRIFTPTTSDPDACFFQDRSSDAALDDYAAFMNGHKDVLVFSTGFGGSGYDMHAALDCRNQKRRFHVVIETGSQADIAVQGLGRTHRNNQKWEPIVMLGTSDLPGDRIASTRLLRRIGSLGALSMGHREATSQSLFDRTEDFESQFAVNALNETIRNIGAGKYSELSKEMVKAFHQLMDTDYREIGATRCLKYFKKIRFMPLDFQRALLNRYAENYEITAARHPNGAISDAPTVISTQMGVISEDLIFSDANSNENIYALQIDGQIIPKIRTYAECMEEAEDFAMPGESPRVRYLSQSQGKIVAILTQFDSRDPNNMTKKTWRLYTPYGVRIMDDSERFNLRMALVPPNFDAAELWNNHAEKLEERARESNILLHGSLLRIAPIVSAKTMGLMIIPFKDGSQLAGYLVDADTMTQVRADAPSIARAIQQADLDAAIKEFEMGHNIAFKNNMKLSHQVLPKRFLPVLKQDQYDPNDKYVVVELNTSAVGQRTMKNWLKDQKLSQADIFGLAHGRTATIAPWEERENIMRALMKISEIEDYDAI